MKVLAFDVYPIKELECDQVKYVTLEEVWQNSDIISLYCPLLESTKHIINKDTISKMKKGVIIINTSRGGCVDT